VKGIEWAALGDETHRDMVDIFLGREFGLRGFAVNGRGGDEGIDYNVDDGKIIFEYKFYWNGISISQSRKKQIQKSFKTAMSHDPNEWILVIPATLTPPERWWITGLGKGKRVKIGIRDLTWHTEQLIQHTDVRDHYLRGSDIDYLHRLGEKLKHNPVVRNADDATGQVRAIQDSLSIVDPNWRLDLTTFNNEVIQVIRPKDPRAPERAPINISFSVLVPADSPERSELAEAEAFGPSKPIILSGDLIKNFTITGSPLVNYEGDVDQIEIHPGRPTDWTPTELILTDGSERKLGICLAESRIVSRSAQGMTVELSIDNLARLTIRWPLGDDPAGGVDISTGPWRDASPTAAFEAADFLLKFDQAATLEVRVKGQRLGLMGIERAQFRGPVADLLEALDEIRLLADDLRVIERESGARFRIPEVIEVEDRIGIRNLRLLYEGHCVAHATWSSFSARLSGERNESFDQILDTEPRWLVRKLESATVGVLGQEIEVSQLNYTAAVAITQQEIDDINAAFDEGRADGHPVTWETAPGDRIRIYMPDRVGPDQQLVIQPWGLRGITQQGLDGNGERFVEN
jgi:hypothetical protein